MPRQDQAKTPGEPGPAAPPPEREPVRLETLLAVKRSGGKFSVLTCYDATTAHLMQEAGVEVLLVGDTAGEVILGLPDTHTIDPMFLLTLTAAVRRGAPACFVMGDLPLACRTDGDAAAVDWCRRFMTEAGCDAVKIEVTGADVALVRQATAAGVPVVAHLGLRPQAVSAGEPYRAQGRDAESAATLLREAATMESAGAAMLLLEAVASESAAEITRRAAIPVIGCVAGPGCDGTVVVMHDMLGLNAGHRPRAVRQYENLADRLTPAFAAYVADVQAGRFPSEATSIHMKPGEWDRLRSTLPPSA